MEIYSKNLGKIGGSRVGIIKASLPSAANDNLVCLDKLNPLTLSETSPGFYVSAVLVFCKHCGKRRNCS